MNITILRDVVFFYEYCSTERGGFFKNITVIRQAVLFYEHYNSETGALVL
jgi:hypothetical protein